MAKELVKAPADLSVWQANIKLMMARQPLLAATLLEYVKEHGAELAHFENRTPSGVWVEGLTEEPFFQADGEPDVSWTKKDRNVPIFFQYGVGTPPHLFKVIRSLPEEAMALVVIEPNIPLLVYTLMMTHVYAAMPPSSVALTFITNPDHVPESVEMKRDTADAPDGEKLEASMQLFVKGLFDEALNPSLNVQGIFSAKLSRAAVHRGEAQACGEELRAKAHEIREWVLVRLGLLGNSSHDTMLGLRQMALMSPWMVYGYDYTALLESFKGRPAVVVSAGPSLSKNFEQLRDVQDKCVIFANDATLNKLLAAGIRPHVVCALERGIPTFNHFFLTAVRDYPEECRHILLIAQAVCVPNIFGTWPGPKLIVGKENVPMDEWFVSGILGARIPLSGQSVSHMCVGIANEMGAPSIALIGQDFAYSEEGYTHAGGVYSDASRERTKKTNRTGKKFYRIPAALGGEVDTSETWLNFLRYMETVVAVIAADVYDCTEGGALIRGTKIEPLAGYLAEHVAGLDPIAETPAEAVASRGTCADKAAAHARVAERLDAADKDIETAIDIISRIADSLERVSAPAITPARRVRYAAETASMLDELNRVNPMFAFIAQSYVYLSTSELALVRFLDSVDLVERWKKLHMDIVESHVAIIRFIRTWIDYTRMALDYYACRDLAIAPVPAADSYAAFEEIASTLGEGEDQAALRCSMDSLIARADILRHQWQPEALWQCASFLLQEGRAQEATWFMNTAAKLFEDRELPVDTISRFMKEYARVLMTPDLCHLPNYEYARVVLKNAVDAGGDDDETMALRLELGERQKTLFMDTASVMGARYTKELSRWYDARVKAGNAMDADDPMAAMRIIWDGIRDNGANIPGIVSQYFDWLAKNMEKFFGVQDERVKPVIDGILDDMADHLGVIRKMYCSVSYAFLEELAAHGAEITLPSRDQLEAAARNEATRLLNERAKEELVKSVAQASEAENSEAEKQEAGARVPEPAGVPA